MRRTTARGGRRPQRGASSGDGVRAAHPGRRSPHPHQPHAFNVCCVSNFRTVAASAIERESRGVPIVLVNAADPVGVGLVESLERPGGQATGFLSIEAGMSMKWLELLKQVAPRVTRVAVIRDPTTVAGAGQFGAIQGAASSFGVEVTPIDARDNRAIEHAIFKFLRRSNIGLIVTTSRLARHHRGLIIALATQYQLPTVYPNRYYVPEPLLRNCRWIDLLRS